MISWKSDGLLLLFYLTSFDSLIWWYDVCVWIIRWCLKQRRTWAPQQQQVGVRIHVQVESQCVWSSCAVLSVDLQTGTGGALESHVHSFTSGSQFPNWGPVREKLLCRSRSRSRWQAGSRSCDVTSNSDWSWNISDLKYVHVKVGNSLCGFVTPAPRGSDPVTGLNQTLLKTTFTSNWDFLMLVCFRDVTLVSNLFWWKCWSRFLW